MFFYLTLPLVLNVPPAHFGLRLVSHNENRTFLPGCHGFSNML